MTPRRTAKMGTEKCPHTGRTARWCEDQTHTACAAQQAESVALDRKVEREFRAIDPSY